MCDNNFALPIVNSRNPCNICNQYNQCNQCNLCNQCNPCKHSMHNQYSGAPYIPFSFPNCQNPCISPYSNPNQSNPNQSNPNLSQVVTYSVNASGPQTITSASDLNTGCVGFVNWDSKVIVNTNINAGNGISTSSTTQSIPCNASSTPSSIYAFIVPINGLYQISVFLTWQIPASTTASSVNIGVGTKLQLNIYQTHTSTSTPSTLLASNIKILPPLTISSNLDVPVTLTTNAQLSSGDGFYVTAAQNNNNSNFTVYLGKTTDRIIINRLSP